MGELSNEGGFNIVCPVPGCTFVAHSFPTVAAIKAFKEHVRAKHPEHLAEFLKGEGDAERE